MSEIPAIRRPRTVSVPEDWSAWLPNETAQLFEHLRDELSISSEILAVIANEALAESPNDPRAFRQQLAPLFVDLFDRVVRGLTMVLTALEAHGRQSGTIPNAAPLRPEYFRSAQARQVARTSQLRSRFHLDRRSAFAPKLLDVRKVVVGLQIQTRELAHKITCGEVSRARDGWIHLEVVQYDLNTCLQETIVVLKSFFCALPGNELPAFRSRLPV